jgi:hypothetical protein
MDALTIRWNYVHSLIFVNLPRAAAWAPLVCKEKELQASLHQQGVPSDVMTQVIALVPSQGTITLHDPHIVPEPVPH